MTQRRYYHGTEEQSRLPEKHPGSRLRYIYIYLYYVSSSTDTLGSISGEMAPKKTGVDRKMLKAMTYSILYSRKLEKLRCTWHTVKDYVRASAELW